MAKIRNGPSEERPILAWYSQRRLEKIRCALSTPVPGELWFIGMKPQNRAAKNPPHTRQWRTVSYAEVFSVSLGAYYAACSVKSHNLIGGCIYGVGKIPAHFSRDADEPQGGMLLEVLCPFFVEAIAAFPDKLPDLIQCQVR